MPRSNLERPDWPVDTGTALVGLNPDGILGGLDLSSLHARPRSLDLLMDPVDLGPAGRDIDAWSKGIIPRPPFGQIDTKFQAPQRAIGAAANGWAQLSRPEEMESGEHGSGYYTYGTDQTGRPGTTANAQWGTPRTMELIGAVTDRLAIGDRYIPFGVGNISLQSGAAFDHREHRDGLGIDVRPPRTDRAQLPKTYRSPQYDRAATQRLVDAFRATGQVDNILLNDPLIRGVQPWRGHDNHFHVQLKR